MSSQYTYTKDELLLKVSGLTVVYGDSVILRGVNFEVRDIKRPGLTQGQKVALLAPSGTGKAQLFKRLAGLQSPTTGTILVGPDQKPVQAGMVGMVPQNYLLFEHRTIESSLTLAAHMREPDRQKCKAKVAEMLDTFGLTDKAHSYPKELSGGQRQRISIAEQLLSSNHFLLMDEPFSGLDIRAKKKVCDVIDAVAARDELNTIIFSTHDIESAVMIADTILILGRDKDPANDYRPIPGARVIQEIDLIGRDLAWHKDVDQMPAFATTVAEIKSIFTNL